MGRFNSKAVQMGAPSLPGQELEKAVAEVGSAAGKSLVGGLDRLFQSWVGRRAARNEAMAEEIKRDVAHQGERRRQDDLTGDRRRQELAEVDHQYELRDRVAGRLLAQWEAEQRAVEWVAARAVQLTESDSDREEERDLDEDWLRRFFKYVAEVDEKQVLEILAQALSDASMRTKPLIPARALDTLRFFDQRSLDMFRFAAHRSALFGMVPQHFLPVVARDHAVNFDVSLMIEMGLLKVERRQTLTVPIGDLNLTFSTGPRGHYDIEVVKLTHVGKSIAGLLDSGFKALIAALDSDSMDADIWPLQSAVGIDSEMMRKLARQIVGEVHSVDDLSVSGVTMRGGIFDVAIRTERKRSDRDPFELGKMAGLERLDERNRSLIVDFIAVFDDFDASTLPAIAAMDEEPDPAG